MRQMVHLVLIFRAAPQGPLVIIVSLPDQIARVYRNGLEIGVAKVSTGKPGHVTPTGIFTITWIASEATNTIPP